jgi:alpha-1,6-rhamnosyltransferase
MRRVEGKYREHIMKQAGECSAQVSVVIPCYNRERYIARAIESALQCSLVDVIVVDDGSDDRSWSIISSFKGIRFYKVRKSGVSAARNVGLSHARGKFIKFLDSDDTVPPGAIADQLRAANQLSADQIAVGDAISVDADGHLTTPVGYGYSHASPPGIIPAEILVRHIMAAVLPLYPTFLLKSLGGFNTSMTLGEDHELAMRVWLSGYQFVRIPLVVCHVREHEGARLSRNIDASRYESLASAYETIWANLNSSQAIILTPEIRAALGKLIFASGRDAARAGFSPVAENLFSLSASVAGAESWNARPPVRALYYFLSPLSVERVLRIVKSLIGRDFR